MSMTRLPALKAGHLIPREEKRYREKASIQIIILTDLWIKVVNYDPDD